MERFWEHKTLDTMSDDEWEMICDGCAQCCLNKLMDEDTDQIIYTRVACNQLNLKTCKCKNYLNRFDYEPDCIKLTRQNLLTIEWLPKTCAYLYFSTNQTLPEWHPLITGDKKQMHNKGICVGKNIIHEKEVTNWQDYIIYD